MRNNFSFTYFIPTISFPKSCFTYASPGITALLDCPPGWDINPIWGVSEKSRFVGNYDGATMMGELEGQN